jgi:hypothetical protein
VVASLWWPDAAADSGGEEDPGADSAPIRFVVDSGLRPIITATADGVDVAMLLHANAGFVMMLTHDALRRVTGRTVSKESDFGLAQDLRLSSAGRGQTRIRELVTADLAMTDVPCEVFDLPTTNWEGMLGVHWLASSSAAIDFGRARLLLGDAARHRMPLLGGLSIPLEQDADSGRFTCHLGLAAPGTPAGRFVASTVAETTLDIEFARRHGIDLGAPVGEEHGPGGAVVPVYRPAEPIRLVADARLVCTVRPSVYDIYAYGNNARPRQEAALAGYVGADVLRQRGVVVYFGR